MGACAMKITKEEAKHRYKDIISEINVIGNQFDIECIQRHISELRSDGAWYHANIASRKLKDQMAGKHFNLEKEFPNL